MHWTIILFLGSSLVKTASGWTYHNHTEIMSWPKARQFCQTHYTDVVVIQNQEENDYLVSMLPIRNKYYWIGITKTHMNDTWTWVGNNSTWIGNESWAENEPTANKSEFCVEIYISKEKNKNRGKWNNEDCAHKKFAVCYKAQCEATSCGSGKCRETINNITCHCEAGFEGDRCQTAVECPLLPHSDNGAFTCTEGRQIYNSTCHLKCFFGFLLIGPPAITCGANGTWSGPRPTCTSYKHALLAVAGCCALFAICCICCCWMKHRKRKKLSQVRQPGEVAGPSSEVHG